MDKSEFELKSPELAYQYVLDHGYVRYIDHMGSDQRIVESARVSYHSPSKGEADDKRLLFFLYRNKHTSPFEMVKLTLNIKLPIFVMRQYVRHRMQNLNEVSARYTELPNEFYVPTEWRGQDTKNKQGSVSAGLAHEYLSNVLKANNVDAYERYTLLLEQGAARELARMVLPVNIYTECYVTWDLKNLLHFITLREDVHAQWEHQQYGTAIRRILNHLFPWTMEAFDKYKFPVVEMPENKD